MNGARAREPARRRAISVLPTPVGPIIRMFLGVISPRSSRQLAGGASGCAWQWPRRAWQPAGRRCGGRVRRRSPGGHAAHGTVGAKAQEQGSHRHRATEKFKRLGISLCRLCVLWLCFAAVGPTLRACGSGWCRCKSRQRSPAILHDVSGAQIAVIQQRRRRLRGRARPDGHDAPLGFQHVAIAGDDQEAVLSATSQHGFQAAQHAVGAPVARQLNGARTRWPGAFRAWPRSARTA